MKSSRATSAHLASVVCALLAASAVDTGSMHQTGVEAAPPAHQSSAPPFEDALKGIGRIEIVDDGPGSAAESLTRSAEALPVPLAAVRFFPQAGTLWQDIVANNHVDLGSGSAPLDFDCTERS